MRILMTSHLTHTNYRHFHLDNISDHKRKYVWPQHLVPNFLNPTRSLKSPNQFSGILLDIRQLQLKIPHCSLSSSSTLIAPFSFLLPLYVLFDHLIISSCNALISLTSLTLFLDFLVISFIVCIFFSE